MRVVTFVCIALVALTAIAASEANETRVAWNRGDDPFMRMAKKVGSNSPVFLQLTADPAAPADKPADKPAEKPAQAKIEDLKNKVLPAPTEAPAAILQMLGKPGGTPAQGDSTSNAAADAAKASLKAAAAGAPGAAPAQPDQKPAAPAAPANSATQNVPVCNGGAAQTADQSATTNKGQGFTMLVPVKKDAESVDTNKLGATDKMSVNNKDFKSAEKVIKSVGDRHEAFVAKHEKDCQGTICPLEGKKK